jgi:hypothetical protein
MKQIMKPIYYRKDEVQPKGGRFRCCWVSLMDYKRLYKDFFTIMEKLLLTKFERSYTDVNQFMK